MNLANCNSMPSHLSHHQIPSKGKKTNVVKKRESNPVRCSSAAETRGTTEERLFLEPADLEKKYKDDKSDLWLRHSGRPLA